MFHIGNSGFASLNRGQKAVPKEAGADSNS